MWLKAPSSLLLTGAAEVLNSRRHRTDYEAELAILSCWPTRAPCDARGGLALYAFGYTTAQDISDRNIQNSESQWARAKSFDTFTPLGPYIETKLDPTDLTIQLFQNGQLRQNSNASQLIFNCAQLVSFVSTQISLSCP